MSKKVLVLGGAGYIGGYTTDLLMDIGGHDVCVFDKLVYETRYLKDVKFVYGDIRDTALVLKTAEDYDVVVIMAALVGDPACAVDVNLTDEINHIAVKNICEQLDPSKHVIFMSTCSVYGSQTKMLNEESKTKPLSAYASTKLQAEKYVTKRNGTIFRLGTVYGLGDAFSRIRLDLVVNVLTMKSVHDGKIQIFGGEQWRPLICVKDVAGYINEAINNDVRGAYILSEGNYTMRELGQIMEKIFPEVEVTYTDISFEDARNYKVDNVKSHYDFSYYPIFELKPEINKMKKIFEERRICDINEDTYNNGKFIKNNLSYFKQ